MKLKNVFFVISSLVVLGCSTTQAPPEIQKWKELQSSEEYKQESQTYSQRMGAFFCWRTGVVEFIKNPQIKPSKDCLYPTSQLITEREDEEATFFKGEKTLKQAIKQLKVLQVADDGFIVEAPKARYGADVNVIFIQKTDESGVVDGTYLDDRHYFNVYQYVGPFTYQTAFGSKTVHSFKKVTLERIHAAVAGLKHYRPLRDFYISNELWAELAKDGQ